jgi:hypothetical protein
MVMVASWISTKAWSFVLSKVEMVIECLLAVLLKLPSR